MYVNMQIPRRRSRYNDTNDTFPLYQQDTKQRLIRQLQQQEQNDCVHCSYVTSSLTLVRPSSALIHHHFDSSANNNVCVNTINPQRQFRFRTFQQKSTKLAFTVALTLYFITFCYGFQRHTFTIRTNQLYSCYKLSKIQTTQHQMTKQWFGSARRRREGFELYETQTTSGTDEKIAINKNSLNNNFDQLAATIGEKALRKVQWLGSRVATADTFGSAELLRMSQENRINSRYGKTRTKFQNEKIYGTGGSTFDSNRKELFHDDETSSSWTTTTKIAVTENSVHNKSSRNSYDTIDNNDDDDDDDDIYNEYNNYDVVNIETNTIEKRNFPGGSDSATTGSNSRRKNNNNNKNDSNNYEGISVMVDSDSTTSAKERQVWEALSKLEGNMQLLDRLTGQKPQLSFLEFTLLSSAVAACIGCPLVFGGGQLASFVAPSAAAFAAAIGVGAEYTGKVAVADGKEVAAASIQCAAEAEGYLANAERAKAVLPLCVGVSATTATLALLVPVLIDTIAHTASAAGSASVHAATATSTSAGSGLFLGTEIYLLCPLIGVLAAAVADLAYQDVTSICSLAIGVGNRRFSRSGLVGRTWLSTTEFIDKKSKNALTKWRTFTISVIPAPLIGVLVPGSLSTKAIVIAAVAAAQSAYFLAQCEYILGRATDAVALKARSAAVCDTYANQGARSAAILPFTSALSGLCAAATAAIVELPFVEHLAVIGTPSSLLLQVVTISFFPTFSALFAAAASVSKARCEVDAEAAMQAASTLALPYTDSKQDPILQPVVGVWELIRLTFTNSIRQPFRRYISRTVSKLRLRTRWKRLLLRFGWKRRSCSRMNLIKTKRNGRKGLVKDYYDIRFHP